MLLLIYPANNNNRLSGFTLRNCILSGNNNIASASAAVRLAYSTSNTAAVFTFENCIFQDNTGIHSFIHSTTIEESIDHSTYLLYHIYFS